MEELPAFLGEATALASEVEPTVSEVVAPLAANASSTLNSAVNTAMTPLSTSVGEATEAIAQDEAAFADSLAQTESNLATTCSFRADTPVSTADGSTAIGDLQVGDHVLAYNQATGTTASYTVTAVLVHTDPIIAYLTLGGERLVTTPEHPFFTAGRDWVAAGELHIGDRVRRVDGSYGAVQSIVLEARPQVMYNLTVATAHTFFVGYKHWLVHNTCDEASSYVYRGLREGEDPTYGLSAKFPGGLSVEPIDHIRGEDQFTPWISTTKDVSVALDKYDSGNGVVNIDLSNITTRSPKSVSLT